MNVTDELSVFSVILVIHSVVSIMQCKWNHPLQKFAFQLKTFKEYQHNTNRMQFCASLEGLIDDWLLKEDLHLLS